MRVFVTGSAGSIGSELVRQYASLRHSVFCYDINDTANFDLIEELKLTGQDVTGQVGDINEYATLKNALDRYQPDLIVHAAALKVVTSSEQCPIEYCRTNVLGLDNVLKASRGASGVFISTDKAVSRNSVMGMTKAVGEVMAKNAGWITVRFANVLESNGSVIPLWRGQIRRNEPVTVTDRNCERYFMSIGDAVGLVRKAAQEGKPGETFVLDMGEPVNIYEMAKRTIAEEGKGEDYRIRFIGLRKGETLSEELMTEDEWKRTEKRGEFWVLKP